METIKIKIGVLIINEDNELLLIKEKIRKNNKPLWNIIKGTYDGKEDIFLAAAREAKEEACVNVELISLLGFYIFQEDETARVQINFLARINSGIPDIPSLQEQHKHDENISEIKFFRKDELLNMNEDEFISPLIFKSIKNWIEDKSYPLEVIKKY